MSGHSNIKSILAFETAVQGGSIALYFDGEFAALDSEDAVASRAEDLVPNIHSTLDSAGISLGDIDIIAVSTGPGSYTGIRIGLSTALGLKSASNAGIIGVSALLSMAHSSRDRLPLITAIPMGREDVAWQTFASAHDFTEANQPQICSLPEFSEMLAGLNAATSVLAHPTVHGGLQTFGAATFPSIELIESDQNIASYLALAAASRVLPSGLSPIYLLNPARSRGLF